MGRKYLLEDTIFRQRINKLLVKTNNKSKIVSYVDVLKHFSQIYENLHDR